MPILFKAKEAFAAGNTVEVLNKSDKMKEVVKKLNEGKAGIKEVFYAVDNEGDSNGAISIDEFQAFVRRLGRIITCFLYFFILIFCSFFSSPGMELSKHRVNEIFAFIKKKHNKALRISAEEKS